MTPAAKQAIIAASRGRGDGDGAARLDM